MSAWNYVFLLAILVYIIYQYQKMYPSNPSREQLTNDYFRITREFEGKYQTGKPLASYPFGWELIIAVDKRRFSLPDPRIVIYKDYLFFYDTKRNISTRIGKTHESSLVIARESFLDAFYMRTGAEYIFCFVFDIYDGEPAVISFKDLDFQVAEQIKGFLRAAGWALKHVESIEHLYKEYPLKGPMPQKEPPTLEEELHSIAFKGQ